MRDPKLLDDDSGNLSSVGASADGEDVGVGDIDDLPTVVEVIDEDRCAVVREGADSDSAINWAVASVDDAFDVNAINQSGFHEFPPVGKKLVGPKSEYERMSDGSVRVGVLPFDPERTWRIVPSTK